MTHLLLQLLHRIPGPVRRWLRGHAAPLVRWIKAILIAVQDLRLPVFRFETPEFNLVVIGRKHDLSHLIKLSCGGMLPGVPLGKVWAWQAGSRAQQWQGPADLVVVNLAALWCCWPWPGRRWRHRMLEMPALVNQIVPLSQREEEILPLLKNTRTVAELNKIQELGYRCTLTRDKGRYIDFYHRFYKPYISGRFAEVAYVAPLTQWLQACEGSDLLLVWRDEEIIAGAVNRRQDDGYLMDYIGIRDADVELLQQGAAGACYYFTMVEALRAGFRWVGLGRSLPFLNDGVLFFKKKWASRLGLDLSLYRRLWLDGDLASPALQQLLTRHPMILMRGMDSNRCTGPDALYGLLMLDLAVYAQPKELRPWLKRVSDAGLAELVVLVRHLDQPGARKMLKEIIPHLPNPVRLIPMDQAMPVSHLINQLGQGGPETATLLAAAAPEASPESRKDLLKAGQTVI